MNVLGGKWGRESHEICGTSDSFVNWCTHVVVRKLKSVCDGQFSCNINVTNGFFGNIDPCLGSSKYLNFTYECIPASGRRKIKKKKEKKRTFSQWVVGQGLKSGMSIYN